MRLRSFFPSTHIHEHYPCSERASELGIAPHVYQTFLAHRAILMDYIDQPTLTFGQAKQASSCVKVAHALHKVHAMNKNPYVFLSVQEKMEKLCEQPYINRSDSLPKEAIGLIRQGNVELGSLRIEKRSIHGDLNPRNIFLTDTGIFFIDWSETNWDDPFYDLTGFALLNGLNSEEEFSLLETYLQHSLSSEEKKHYLIVKKIQLAALALTCYAITKNLLHQFSEQLIDPTTPLKSWHHYVTEFAKNDPHLSAQFFCELARCALKDAKYG